MTKKRDTSDGPAALITAENGAARPIGTAIANYTNVPSCERPAVFRSRKKTWGGARNRADRPSDMLADAKVAELLDAATFALATGRVFQRHWIIHYGKAGVQPRDGMRFVSKLLNLVSKQARREGGEMTALWVRECASDYGEHVHILLHLPAGMRLQGRTRRWIAAALDHVGAGFCDRYAPARPRARGKSWVKGVSMVRIVAGRLNKIGGNIDDAPHRENAANVVRYLLKSASAETGAALELTRAARGGRIIGKRCGWTQNIGVAAQRASNP
ncbi:MAG: hypothetical protein ACO1OD_09195 [Croceibacterium sp.]